MTDSGHSVRLCDQEVHSNLAQINEDDVSTEMVTYQTRQNWGHLLVRRQS